VASPIKTDENVVLFPTVAHLGPDAWHVPLRGWIFEPELDSWRRAVFTRGLTAMLGPEAAASPVFADRVSRFLYDNERGKNLSVTVGDGVVALGTSGANGLFEGETTLPSTLPAGPVRVVALTRPSDDRTFAAEVFLVAPEGLTIISDIDDTVKISNVRDKTALMRKTFLEPFVAVPGMAERYRSWLSATRGGHVHFVSSSPWQLLQPLQEMLVGAGFPPGSFDLVALRLKEVSAIKVFSGTRQRKIDTISAHISRFPQRRFALVGDSGEHDPEVYGEVARRYPAQVVYIAIRDVTAESGASPRYTAAFGGVTARWEVFTDPASLQGPPG